MQLKLIFLLFSLFFKSLGAPEPQTAIILLQNNHEIRATGGFLGSYAKLSLPTPGVGSIKPAKDFSSDSGAESDSSDVKSVIFSFQDIYVPDGQIQGHVDPPPPIQQAFGQGWYKLRDANWDPDFVTSAKTIRWFLEKGNETNPDVLIATNLSTIQKILEITGPFEIANLKQTINAKNISLILQNEIQQNFFPGSTNKKDLITATGEGLSQKLSSLTNSQKLKIIKLIYQELKTGEILLNSNDLKLQAYLEKKNLAGQLKPSSCKNCLSDTVAIIESNLGSNKANAFITRQTTHTITKGFSSDSGRSEAKDSSDVEPHYITHQITINYQNSSPSENPDPPNHHGGDYINYLRFYIPQKATNIKAPQGFSQEKKHGFTEIGFFHTTPHQSTSSITISYQLPVTSQKSYQLSILKQSGIGNSPQTINLFGQTQKTNLTQNFKTKNPQSLIIPPSN